jgi:dihydrofolate reductase
MRTLIVQSFLTLDGVMQAPGGPEEDPSGGFTLGGWSVNYWDDMMGGVIDAATAVPFDLLLGRKTYEIFAAHWPYAGDDPMAHKLNRATKHVASTTLRSVEWSGSRLISGDVATAVKQLKEQPGPELQVHGSGGLIQTLLAADLVDEFRLWTFPLVVGNGKRLFGNGTVPAALQLIDGKTSTTGVRIDRYRRAGPVRTGSFDVTTESTRELYGRADGIRTGSFALEVPTEAELERRRKLGRET